MQKIIVWIVVILIIMWALFAFTGKQKQDTAPLAEEATSAETLTTAQTDEAQSAQTPVANASIIYSDGGFTPSIVTVKKGTRITFSNESGKNVWPASALHPTHTVYPGSSVTKCGTEDASKIFDACDSVTPGNSWSFVFDEPGSWKYHDHINATHFGTIVVTE